MTGRAIILRSDARNLPLPDASVDLIVTSPPYWGQRSYRDGGQHYDGQIGDEPTPAEYINNLITCTTEWVRVLKPSGSIFVNLGDKRSDRSDAGPASARSGRGDHAEVLPPGRTTTAMAPRKSLLGLPWRYAIRCVDELGLTIRNDQIWHKISALPESVTDRCATRHEYLFHLTTQERYYAAVDRIREPTKFDHPRRVTPAVWHATGQPAVLIDRTQRHPLGRLPGSVWDIASEPLNVPDHIAHAACCGGVKRPGCEDGLDHHAAFPCELPRRIIQGWSPSGICTNCSEGRVPAATLSDYIPAGHGQRDASAHRRRIPGEGRNPLSRHGEMASTLRTAAARTITGETCACPDTSAPTHPAVVVDPFGGTGTTALVASVLGRIGISVDRSADYCRLATWRTTDPGERARALRVPKPPVQKDGQLDLFGEVAS